MQHRFCSYPASSVSNLSSLILILQSKFMSNTALSSCPVMHDGKGDLDWGAWELCAGGFDFDSMKEYKRQNLSDSFLDSPSLSSFCYLLGNLCLDAHVCLPEIDKTVAVCLGASKLTSTFVSCSLFRAPQMPDVFLGRRNSPEFCKQTRNTLYTY